MQSFLQDVQDLITFLEQYKTTVIVASMWFLHKFIPYCIANGGLKTVLLNIWSNNNTQKKETNNEKTPPTIIGG